MTLAAGTRLGPYEVVAPIGAGGMGEVYRARDTRLDRSVAIKVLPAHLSSDPQLRERWTQRSLCSAVSGRHGEVAHIGRRRNASAMECRWKRDLQEMIIAVGVGAKQFD
jgi:serine/threonine protein kinase